MEYGEVCALQWCILDRSLHVKYILLLSPAHA